MFAKQRNVQKLPYRTWKRNNIKTVLQINNNLEKAQNRKAKQHIFHLLTTQKGTIPSFISQFLVKKTLVVKVS